MTGGCAFIKIQFDVRMQANAREGGRMVRSRRFEFKRDGDAATPKRTKLRTISPSEGGDGGKWIAEAHRDEILERTRSPMGISRIPGVN